MVFLCSKCGNTSIYLVKKGESMVGAYCSDCGSWVKWVGKKDLANLERQGFYVQPEGYVSPTVKIKQEQLAKDKELLTKINATSKVAEVKELLREEVDCLELDLDCRYCGALAEDEVYVRKLGVQQGIYCKCCDSWIKWASKKEHAYLQSIATDFEPKEHQVKTLDYTCKKCGEVEDGVYLYEKTKAYVGLYCQSCNTWIKWVGTKEREDLLRAGVEIVTMESDNATSAKATLSETKANTTKLEARENNESKIKDDTQNNKPQLNESKGCHFCNGAKELQSLVASSVDLTYFGGVLSVIGKDGTEILGSYKLNYCPCCGEKL